MKWTQRSLKTPAEFDSPLSKCGRWSSPSIRTRIHFFASQQFRADFHPFSCSQATAAWRSRWRRCGATTRRTTSQTWWCASWCARRGWRRPRGSTASPSTGPTESHTAAHQRTIPGYSAGSIDTKVASWSMSCAATPFCARRSLLRSSFVWRWRWVRTTGRLGRILA